MPAKTNLSVSPYNDDFTESKSFYRILFKPSFAVQARELNQLQTILQNQIEKFGGHIFEDGSPVVGGELVLNTKLKSLKLETLNSSAVEILASNFNKQIIEGATSGARGQVITVTASSGIDPTTLIYEPLNGIDFNDGESISTSDDLYEAITVSASGSSGISDAQGVASIVSINRGFYFINGFFVFVDKQDIILEKYSTTPTYRVGLTVTESLPKATDDISLLDNAQGTFNYAAPGADRLKIELLLAKRQIIGSTDVDKNSDVNFYELLRVVDGKEVKNISYPVYSELEKTLARRTYDESGDYTVKPFGLQIVDHNPQDGSSVDTTNKFSVGLEPGKAYIKGFEFENISTEYLSLDKGKEYLNVSNYIISSGFGNKVITKNVSGFFNIKKNEMVDLHCVDKFKLSTGVENIDHGLGSDALNVYSATKIGTARIRDIDWYAESNSSNTTHFHSDYETYLYDIRISSSQELSAQSGSSGSYNTIVLNASSSNIDGAYDGVNIKVITTKSGITTTDNRTILTYDGTTKKAILDRDLSVAMGDATETSYILNFSFNDIESIIVAHSSPNQNYSISEGSGRVYLTSSADIDEVSKFNNDPGGDSFLSDTDRNTLLFELPNSPIKSINGNIKYQTRVLFEGQTTTTAPDPGKTTITTSSGTFVGGGSSTNDPNRNNENYLVVVKDKLSQTALANGQILDFGEGSNRTITFASDTTATIDTDADSTIIDVIGTIEYTTTGDSRTKELVIGQTDTAYETSNTSEGQVCISNPNKIPLKKDTLMIPDVLRLVKVLDSGNSANPVTADQLANVISGQNTSFDITDNYILDTGQRDNYYDWSSIILKVGVTPPVGQLLIIVDYFRNDGEGCFTVNSYSTDITAKTTFNNGTEIFTYESIPSYTSSVTGKTYQLRDCLDFRPVRELADNADGANTENTLISEGPEKLSYTQAFDEAQIAYPLPDSNLTVDYSHYLGRIDKLLLTRDREFKVLKGVSSVEPVSPPDDDDSMTLYIVKIPAYTFNLTDIETKYIDNKRYTMRDIGKLEKRIEQLEYYATLSLLERETAEKTITSENTIDSIFNPIGEKFKSGILVDGFSGHSVGDVQQEEYLCSIDYDKKLLRPRFETTAYQFEFSPVGSQSLNVQKTGDIITLPYTTTDYINQPLVSDSVEINPFGIKNFTGKMKSYPDSSVFFDKNIKPSVLVNLEGQYDNWAYSTYITNGFGTHWNDWTDIWTGKFVNTDPETSIIKGESSLRQTKLVGEVSAKLGIRTNRAPESIFRTISNKIVNVSIVPYMESQTIYFSAKGVKPSTDMWLFFGEKSVTGSSFETKTADTLVLSSLSGDFIEGETITETGGATATVLNYVKTGETSAIIDIKLPDNVTAGADNLFASGEISADISGATASVSSVTISTNVTKFTSTLYGTVSGSFNIIQGRHLTGENLLRLIDSQDGSIINSSSVAEKTFYALGATQTREKLISSTRPYIIKRPDLNEKYVVQTVASEKLNQESLVQPLNQTFFINSSEYPEGIFIKDTTLYFKSKPTGSNLSQNPPVILQIRPVIDGFPSPSIVLPFSEVVKDVNSINAVNEFPTTSNNSHGTTFEFESPVYLSPGEYSLTIQTNSQDYQLWSATTSSNHLGTTNNITKQPYTGGLYKLQKSGVWSRIDTESLMFNIKRCNFLSDVKGYAYFLSKNTSTSGSTSNTTFSTFKFLNNMLVFNSSEVTHNYQISNSTNFLQSSVQFSQDQNITLDDKGYIFNDDVGSFTANVDLKTTSSDVSPVIDLSRMTLITTKNIINNGNLSNNDFVIVSGGSGYTTTGLDVELYGGGPDPSVNTITATSGTAGVDVVIEDGVITGVNVIDGGKGYVTNPTMVITHGSGGTGAEILVNSETSADKGNLETRYITRRVTLRDGFDASDLRVILNAYKPQGTNIYVYYKVISSTDSDPFDDKPYQIMKQFTDSAIYSTNENDFREYEYVTFNDAASYTDENGVFYDNFKTFAIKICMISDDDKESKIPKIRDLRAIALAD